VNEHDDFIEDDDLTYCPLCGSPVSRYNMMTAIRTHEEEERLDMWVMQTLDRGV